MIKLLLLGAGFSRNWGGWLAAEAFEYLLGCPEVTANSRVQNLLWQHKDSGGYESALASLQSAWKLHPQENLPFLVALQDAVRRMFFDMNTAFLRYDDLEFQQAHERMVRTALVRFDAIFTLNQDLLLEHRYLNDNVALALPGQWDGFQLPGLTPQSSKDFPNVKSTANRDWLPMDPSQFEVLPRHQPYFKLHGSSNWTHPTGSPLLVMGGNKEGEIKFHPILNWYNGLFENYLAQPNTRLLVIGYGFKDAHINRAITEAVEKAGLKIFIIDPAGADLAWKLNETRNRGTIAVGTPLEDLFKTSLLGASRRGLNEIFGGDSLEHAKVMRFIEG